MSLIGHKFYWRSVPSYASNAIALDSKILKSFQLTILSHRIKVLSKINYEWYRGIKNITKYMLGFKSFEAAEATIAGIELHRMLKKGQMKNVGEIPAWQQFYELAA